jgi:hypothetical protein
MKKPILASLALAAMLVAEVPVAQAVVFVRTPPPPPRSVRVVGRSPGRGWVWTPGYYRWGGGRYRWTAGRWRRPPRRGAVWVAPTWRAGRGGYTFVGGRWR